MPTKYKLLRELIDEGRQTKPIPSRVDIFKSIEYTPVNQHYKIILTLCDILLRDSSMSENVGQMSMISFLIDMNRLFETFIGKLLKERLIEYNVDLQETTYPEIIRKRLKLRIDILVSYKGQPILILETKYQNFEKGLSEEHVAQVNLYADSTNVRDCGLVYLGICQHDLIYLKGNTKLHLMVIDLVSDEETSFEIKCHKFVREIKSILEPLKSEIDLTQ